MFLDQIRMGELGILTYSTIEKIRSNVAEAPSSDKVDHILNPPENFSLSNYNDDDDESGFVCPCCLPR